MRVIGYRAFAVHLHGEWPLFPVGVQAPPWHAGLNTARCLAGGHSGSAHTLGLSLGDEYHPAESHRPAGPGCHCGFWALHDLDIILEHFPPGNFVHAVVVGSGRVSIFTRGWRAERAQIMALIRTVPRAEASLDMFLGAIAERYGVPVVDAVDTFEYGGRGPWRVNAAKVHRWVSEFGVDARSPKARGLWPEAAPDPLDADAMLTMATQAVTQSGQAVMATPYAPVHRAPKRRWYHWW